MFDINITDSMQEERSRKSKHQNSEEGLPENYLTVAHRLKTCTTDLLDILVIESSSMTIVKLPIRYIFFYSM